MTTVDGAKLDAGTAPAKRDREAGLEDRLETVAWGFLFLLFGAWALPGGQPQYLAVAGAGALLVGVNVVRAFAGVAVGWFSLVLGTTAFVAGLGALGGVRIDDVALFFALIGVVLVAGAVLRPAHTAGD